MSKYTPKVCKIENCKYTGINFRRELCPKHYVEWLKENSTVKNKDRLKPRPAVIDGDIAKIPLGVDAKYGYAIVDREFSWVDRYKWSICNYGYALTGAGSNRVKLHHLIAGNPPEGMVTDHINQNKLDNRKSNLRHASYSLNNINRPISPKNKSGYRHVHFDKRLQKWCVQITRNYLTATVGYYTTIAEAIKARDQYLSKLL